MPKCVAEKTADRAQKNHHTDAHHEQEAPHETPKLAPQPARPRRGPPPCGGSRGRGPPAQRSQTSPSSHLSCPRLVPGSVLATATTAWQVAIFHLAWAIASQRTKVPLHGMCLKLFLAWVVVTDQRGILLSGRGRKRVPRKPSSRHLPSFSTRVIDSGHRISIERCGRVVALAGDARAASLAPAARR